MPGHQRWRSDVSLRSGVLTLTTLLLALFLAQSTFGLSFLLPLGVGLLLRSAPIMLRALSVSVSLVRLYGAVSHPALL